MFEATVGYREYIVIGNRIIPLALLLNFTRVCNLISLLILSII